MSALSRTIRRTFDNIFKNLAEELNAKISEVPLRICFSEAGEIVFEAYKNGAGDLTKEKEIDIEDYLGTIVDFTGGAEVIKRIINESKVVYGNELKCEHKDVNIFLRHKEGELPEAVLMKNDEKIRMIDLQGEIFN